MKKGDIIYFNPQARKNDPNLEDKKHPIICLEDVDSSMEMFHSAILSSDGEPKNSRIKNIEVDIKYFDRNAQYLIPGEYEHEYLVSMGIWKEIPQLPQSENGKISLRGLNVVLCELLKQVPDDKQEELYSELIKLVKKFVSFEYVETDIRTYIDNTPIKSL